MDTNEKTVITEAGPEDMIATVWFSLGYRPRDSLIVLGLEGPQNRVGVMLRVDLPEAGGARPDDPARPRQRLPPERRRALLPALVRDLLTTVAASGAHAVMAVVADEQALARRCPAVVRALRQGAREFGLTLMDVLAVTSTAFGTLICRDRRCCPPDGWPIARVLSSRSAAVHVVNGDTVAGSEADLLADVTPGPADRSVSPADAPWAEVPAGSAGPSRGRESPEQARERRRLWWHRWGQACAAVTGEPGRTAPLPPLPGLSAALHDCFLRDAVLISMLGATPVEVNAMLSGAQEPDQDLGRLLRRSPDRHRLDVGRSVLAGAARVAAEGDRGPALALLAMLAWFQGQGGRSRLLVERARADAPSVSLSRLVEDLLQRRTPPPWRNGPEG
jgi:hypothetical protein